MVAGRLLGRYYAAMFINGRFSKRCVRSNQPGQAHELTFGCYRNQNFLSSSRVCKWLAESIEQARVAQQFSLWAYVFMPNHVHLLLCPMGEQYSIPAILKAIKTPVAIQAIRYLKVKNPPGLAKLATGQDYRNYRFWQKGGGYDRNISEPNTLLNTV